MSDQTFNSARNERIQTLLSNTMSLTGRLRWLKSGNSKTLQQEYHNVFTGEIVWRNVEIVTADNDQ